MTATISSRFTAARGLRRRVWRENFRKARRPGNTPPTALAPGTARDWRAQAVFASLPEKGPRQAKNKVEETEQ
jgi:hypothetical protein